MKSYPYLLCERERTITLPLLALVFLSHVCNLQASIFVYDDLHRITKADYGNGTIIEYTYDAAGNAERRVVSDNRRTLAVTADPPNAGTITGAGATLVGNQASLLATPASGFLFDHWVESGASVGNTPSLTFTVGASRSLTAHFVADNPFNTWRQSNFGTASNTGNSADSSDPDGDGLSNIMEYAFGLDPKAAQSGTIAASAGAISQRGKPAMSVAQTQNGVDFRAVFGRRKDHAAAGLIYTVQFSGDLVNWVNSTVTPTVVADDGTIEAVTIPYPFFVGTKKARFFRVAVSTSP